MYTLYIIVGVAFLSRRANGVDRQSKASMREAELLQQLEEERKAREELESRLHSQNARESADFLSHIEILEKRRDDLAREVEGLENQRVELIRHREAAQDEVFPDDLDILLRKKEKKRNKGAS